MAEQPLLPRIRHARPSSAVGVTCNLPCPPLAHTWPAAQPGLTSHQPLPAHRALLRLQLAGLHRQAGEGGAEGGHGCDCVRRAPCLDQLVQQGARSECSGKRTRLVAAGGHPAGQLSMHCVPSVGSCRLPDLSHMPSLGS